VGGRVGEAAAGSGDSGAALHVVSSFTKEAKEAISSCKQLIVAIVAI